MIIGEYIVLSIIAILILMILLKRESLSIFLIKKGDHYSYNVFKKFSSKIKIKLAPKIIRFEAMFSQGCRYKNDDPEHDLNKLYGFKYGLFPHKNSMRIGWRYKDNQFELWIYAYIRGVWVANHITNIKEDYQWFGCTITCKGNSVFVEIKQHDHPVIVNVKHNFKTSWLRFILFPYFGGNYTAPNDMKIFIRSKSKYLA